MSAMLAAAAAVSVLLAPVCFVQLLYLESLRLRANPSRALEFFKDRIEDRIGLKLESGALAFSLVKHALLLTLAILIFAFFEHGNDRLRLPPQPLWRSLGESIAVSTLVMIGFAHLLPQFFYRRTSGAWIEKLLPVLRLLALAARPLLAVLDFFKSLADLNVPEEAPEANGNQAEHIEALISAGAEEGLIEEDDRKLIQSVVEFGDKTVRQVMTPRPNIVAISEDATLEDLHELVVKEQYSRIPAFRGSIDNITGFIHVRDMFEINEEDRRTRRVSSLLRDISVVPESKPADDLLRLMQEKREHMVAVVDEYGNTAGLATLEDLVEEIVGEIKDEHDPSRDTNAQPDGSYIVSGNFDLDHLAEMFQFRPHGETESTTVGGLVTEWLGHVPAAGESVERDGLRLVVEASDSRRVSQVRISKLDDARINGSHGA